MAALHGRKAEEKERRKKQRREKRAGVWGGEKEEEIKKENPAAWSLLLIKAHRLPLINNLCINTTTDVILKYVALKMPTSNWTDLLICTARDAQSQPEQ